MSQLLFSDEELAILSKYTNSTSVAELLERFGGDIDKLKAYVKWLYKYGGTGSKGSGPDTPSTNWGISAQIDGESIKEIMPLIESKTKSYNLTIRVTRPGTSTYTTKVSYKLDSDKTSGSGISFDPKTLSAEINPIEIRLTNITENGVLRIYTINNDDGTDNTIEAHCLVNHSELKLSLVNNSGVEKILQNEILYYNNININDGLNLKIYHNIYLPNADDIKLNININGETDLDQISLSQYAYNEQHTHETLINLIEILGITDEDGNSDNVAGSYSISVKMTYRHGAGDIIPVPAVYNFTIIPNGLYLKILPVDKEARIYNKKQQSDFYKFKTNIVNLSLMAFNDTNEYLTLNIKTPDNNKPIYTQTFKNRESKIISLYCNSNTETFTENVYIFELISNTKQASFYCYIYIDKDSNELQWFTPDIQRNITNQAYFRLTDLQKHLNESNNILNNIQEDNLYTLNNNFGGTGYIALNSIESNNIITLFSDNTNQTSFSSMMISVGIQYSIVNNDNKEILKFYFGSEASEKTLTLYQNKFIFGDGTSTEEREIFIPQSSVFEPNNKTKYHLINILINKILCERSSNYNDSSQNKYAYELVVYMDGCIEQMLNQYFIKSGENNVTAYKLTSIEANEGNYSINLLDVTYFNDEGINKINMDIASTNYYYKYNNFVDNVSQTDVTNFTNFYKSIFPLFEQEDLVANDIISESNQDSETATVLLPTIKFKGNNIDSLFSNNYTYGVPIIMLHFDLEDDNTDGGIKAFMVDFCKYYKQGALSTFGDKKVTQVIWVDENGKQTNVNTSFTFSLQGSSTGQFKSKNFNLATNPKKDGQNTTYYLWTPNFSSQKNELTRENQDINLSFLPEEVFTFKADAVDSSHSNNTSIGTFVNKNTHKFAKAVQNTSYDKYIKNCLTGFKVLVFFNFTITSENTEVTYFAGIYNFNLGRDSYLNLGYYNIKEVLDNLKTLDGEDTQIQDGFGIYAVDGSNYKPIEGINVAEIQDGSPFYDFSQYHNDILFGNAAEQEPEMMFGDYYPKTDNNDNLIKIQKFVESVSTYGGGLFRYIGKYMSDSEDDNYGYNMSYSSFKIKNGQYYLTHSVNQVPNYLYQFKLSNRKIVLDQKIDISGTDKDPYNNGIPSPAFASSFYGFVGFRNSEEQQNIYTGNNDGINTYLLDYNSLVEYYTICMTFGLVDSVIKNLNIKAFGVDSPFYIAFYDMDTANGRDNGGKYTSPFAFSDYWTTPNNNSSQNIIYRDFYPNTKTSAANHPANGHEDNIADKNEADNVPRGYDIPSSYLFAIAKYAKIFFTDVDSSLYAINPNYLWWKWRCEYTSMDDTSKAPLINANKFIDTYFANESNKINPLIWNLNYRFKYFKKELNNYNSVNTGAFHGKGIEFLRDWLTKRFHILDAYFNIQQDYKLLIQKYDKDTDIWNNLTYNGNTVNEPLFFSVENTEPVNQGNIDSYIKDFRKSDIQLNSSIFGGEGTKYTNSSVNVNIKSLEYSPMYFEISQSKYSFICVDDNTKYAFDVQNITKPASGQITMHFGGSYAWKWVENLDSLIESKELIINSTYLENIYIKNSTVDNLILQKISSVKTIDILSPKSKCAVTIINDDVDNAPNLKSINLKGTCCGLNLKNVNIVDIDCSNMQKADDENKAKDIKLEDCKRLNSVNINGSTFESFICTNCWKGQQSSSAAQFGQEYSNAYVIEILDTNIKKIELTNVRHDNLGIIIKNANALENLVLKGFNYIIIDSCHKLKQLTITDNIDDENKRLKSLSIINCYPTNNEGTKLNYDNGQTMIHCTGQKDGSMVTIDSDLKLIDLTVFSELKAISFEQTWFIESVKLPNNEITLLKQAFYKTNIETISFNDYNDGNIPALILSQPSQPQNDESTVYNGIFEDTRFTLCGLNRTVQYPLKFKVINDNASIAKLFKINEQKSNSDKNTPASQINYATVVNFFNTFEGKSKIRNMSELFYGQSKICLQYDENEKSFYTNIAHDTPKKYSDIQLIHLSDFSNVDDISSMFARTNLFYLNKNIFTYNQKIIGSGNGTDTINITNFAIPETMNMNNIIYMEDGLFDVLYNKYSCFYANTFNLQNEKIKQIYNIKFVENNVSNNDNPIQVQETVNLRHIFAPNNQQFPNKLIKIQGFNILNDYVDFDGLFTNTDTNINVSTFIFCLNNIKNVKNINKMGLKYDNNLTIFYNALINDKNTANRNDEYNNRIIISDFINYSTVFKTIIDNVKNDYVGINGSLPNIFNFYKTCDLDSNEWTNIWRDITNANVTDISHLFNKCQFESENLNSNNEICLEIPTNDNNITTANYLFSQTTAAKIEKNDNNEIIFAKQQGIKLTDNTIKTLTNITQAQYMFYAALLDNAESYPIPENLFVSNSKLINISSMFASIVLSNENGYTSYHSGANSNAKLCYYVYNISDTSNFDNVYNYELFGKDYYNDNFKTNKESKKDCYPILPPNIFKNQSNKTIQIVSSFISNTKLEGYLPEGLFSGTKIADITNIIFNCKIIPQLIGTYNKENSTIYNLDKNTVDIYSFLPNNYITENIKYIDGLCSFKLFTMLSKTNIANIENEQRLYLMTNKSFSNNLNSGLNPTTECAPMLNICDMAHKDTLGEACISGCVIYDGTQDKYIVYTYNPGAGTEQNNINTKLLINAFVNINDDNTVFEGFDKTNNNTILSRLSKLISPTISVMYYGYLFKKDTEIELTDLNVIKPIMNIYSQDSLGELGVLPSHDRISEDIILPKINTNKNYYLSIGSSTSSYLPSSTKLSNPEYNGNKNLFNLNNTSKSITIKQNQLDGLENLENGSEAYYNYILNYLLLFNNWSLMGSKTNDIYSGTLDTHNKINIEGIGNIINGESGLYRRYAYSKQDGFDADLTPQI